MFNTMPNNKRLFIENLPPEFRRKDAVEMGERFGVSRATVDRMLETLFESSLPKICPPISREHPNFTSFKI